jgi:DedD protein
MDDSNAASGTAARKKSQKSADVSDPILPEKKRARRRLVGAVTITLAAIIVLPMIFDSEPRTVPQDLLIDIPSRDKPSKTVSKEPAKKKTKETSEITPDSDKPSSGTAVVSSEKKGEAAKPVEKVVKDKPITESKGEAKSVAKGETAKKTDDPIGQLIAQQNAKKANTKPTDAKAEEESKFVIQVAAVSSQDKVKELQGKLQKAGLSSHTQKVALKEGGERIRIRIGPLSGRKELNSTCARLSELKLPCTLVN